MSTTATIAIKLEAQTATLKKGFGEARRSIDNLGKGMSGNVATGMAKFHIGLLAVKTALNFVRGAVNMLLGSMADMDKTQKFADRIGIAADQLAILNFAAEQTGASAGSFNTAIEKMSRSVSEAADGTGEAKDALAKLGLSVETLKAMAPDQQFAAIADAIKGVGNASDKTAIVMDIFGRSGGALINMLDLGSEGLNKFGKEAEDLGLLMGDSRRGIEEANDAINRMKKAWGALVAKVAIAVAPALAAIADVLSKIVGAFNRIFGSATGATGKLKEFGAVSRAAMAPAVDAASTAAEIIEKKVKESKKKIVDLASELARVDVGKTMGIGAVTRRSSAGFGALQQAGRDTIDRERRHVEQLRVLGDILLAVRAGSIELAPVRI